MSQSCLLIAQTTAIGRNICEVDGRRARRDIDYKIHGCSIKLFGICTQGHRFVWESSDVITSKAGGHLYLDNLNFASALILSGNNFHKIIVFARFYGLNIIGVTTFHGYQRNIICPAVDTFYKQEQVSLLSTMYTVSKQNLYFVYVEQAIGPGTKQGRCLVW